MAIELLSRANQVLGRLIQSHQSLIDEVVAHLAAETLAQKERVPKAQAFEHSQQQVIEWIHLRLSEAEEKFRRIRAVVANGQSSSQASLDDLRKVREAFILFKRSVREHSHSQALEIKWEDPQHFHQVLFHWDSAERALQLKT